MIVYAAKGSSNGAPLYVILQEPHDDACETAQAGVPGSKTDRDPF